MAASASEVEEFMESPLVSWLGSCLPQPERLSEYASLFDGLIIHEVVLQIDPEPAHHVTKLAGLEDQALVLAKVKNFDSILRNVKALYEEELGQTMLVMPECICLGKTPQTKKGLENMKLLLLLLLGAAVQCPNKEIFITRIKELDVRVQHGIVECIKQVTDNQTVVLTPDSSDLFHSPAMLNHVRRLAKERDYYLSHWTGLIINEGLCSEESSAAAKHQNNRLSSNQAGPNSSNQNISESNHLAVELADWKARLRKQRQELEEKSEHLSECKEELDHTKVILSKLRIESQEWFNEARKLSAYRDEVDALRERADRADRLEQEVQKYREKLADAEFHRSRAAELREDNRVLLETRDMLEEQLTRSRRRADHCLVLEQQIMRLKQEANDMALEHDVSQQKIQDLLEENTHLQYVTKSALNETNNSLQSLGNDHDAPTTDSGENSLSEQLTSNAQARALKLELENKRLVSAMDSLKEQTLMNNSEKLLELEKEKKRLTLKCDQLQEKYNRVAQQNSELEDVFRNALEENRKLHDSLDAQKANVDRVHGEKDLERVKLQELEKHLESVTKDKQKIQLLCESIQRRADDLDRSLEMKTKEINSLKPQADKYTEKTIELSELQTKLMSVEKENAGLSRELNKYKNNLESKDVLIDQLTADVESNAKEITKLNKDLDLANLQSVKMQELESKLQELSSLTKMDGETIQMLQKDLINEKVCLEKIKNCIEKLGLNVIDIISSEVPIEDLLDKIMSNPDLKKAITDVYETIFESKSIECSCKSSLSEIPILQTDQAMTTYWKTQCQQLCSELSTLQSTYDVSQAEIATLQVSVATLTSQNGSLASQHMTLQLANSQLAAEKEEIVKTLEELKNKHDNLLIDQVALQTLHEQLNTEYEGLLTEKESLKVTIRDLKLENREMKEESVAFEKKINDMLVERDALKIESRNLTNLRAEHSKLKDDFRNLFTASDRLKNEYRNIQEEYRKIRTDSSQLKLRNTEMSGELNNRTELINGLELELNKTQQRCEMLLQMNATLDTDRRSLMDHVSQLLTQYHELLAHSLQDKQHYHQEEKMFADRLNNLCRQKEKLEEKIMEHYKKLDNCTPKRKGFGASLVKRVRKAGTDLINRVPSRSNRKSWTIDENSKSQLTLAGSESGESDNGNQESENKEKLLKSSSEESKSVQASTSLVSLESPRRSPSETNFARRLSNSSFPGTGGGGDDALIRASLRRRPHKTMQANTSAHRNSFQGFDGPDNNIIGATTGPTSALGFGSAGSRRTVYVAEDNEEELQNDGAPRAPVAPTAQSTPAKEASTFLVYNRISTVIGEGAARGLDEGNAEPEPQDQPAGKDGKKGSGKPGSASGRNSSKESAIWYEYGCV